MNDFTLSYCSWCTDSYFDEDTRDELQSLTDEKEIEDRFYKNIEFGTGGLRAVMGAGTNRINKYTVGRATAGLGNYLINKFGPEASRVHGVAIGYDTRNNSDYFARVAADVLSGMGIFVKLSSAPIPTPQLSFSVKYFEALAGIVITASHNPKEYNGYKVYDEYGCQLVPDKAKVVSSYIDVIEDFKDVNFTGNPDLIEEFDTTDDFISAVMEQSRFSDKTAKQALKIVYTPLHGTGNVPVQRVLSASGFTNVNLVEEQADWNGNFPTVISPNPEDRHALELGIAKAKKINADIVLGTDPDCDRVGVAVKDGDDYRLITGNQMGALLMDFVLSKTDLTSVDKPAAVKTVVTSELGAEIAKKHGLSVFSTLTGFKYIGEKITEFENARENGDKSRDYTFIFGYEESYGYLAGTHARDKDGVVSSLLICEMAASLKAQGKTLLDRLNEIYEAFGYYEDALDSFTLKGKNGLEQIFSMMEDLRSGKSPFEDTEDIIDYNKPVEAEPGFGYLPTSNVLKYILKDGSWIAVRPSGTEPKIKIYYSIKADNRNVADKKLQSVRNSIQSRLGLEKI